MIIGTITESSATRTSFGLEYTVEYDVNSKAGANSGTVATALSSDIYSEGDRVALEYRTGPSYGLWFIVGLLN